MEDSDVLRIKTTHSKLFKTIHDKDDNDYREGYRQLKHAMINQNDKINELYFKSKELNAHLSELHWFKNFRTWFVLGVSKITNNFGFDWFFPLLWIISYMGLYHFLKKQNHTPSLEIAYIFGIIGAALACTLIVIQQANFMWHDVAIGSAVTDEAKA